jgi:hypothetical protein
LGVSRPPGCTWAAVAAASVGTRCRRLIDMWFFFASISSNYRRLLLIGDHSSWFISILSGCTINRRSIFWELSSDSKNRFNRRSLNLEKA